MRGTPGNLAGGLGSIPDRPGLLPALLAADPDVDADGAARTTRDRIVDGAAVLLAVGFSCLLYLMMSAQGRLADPPVFVVDVALGAVGCVSLWWRRRWPVAIAVVLGLSSAVLSFTAGPCIVALFTVAVQRRFIVAAPIAALNVVTSLSYQLLYPDPETGYWTAIAWATGVTAVITAWAMFVRARRQLMLSLRDRALRAEAEQQLRADQARRAERARIAREMHDVLAHRLSLVSTYAGALELRRASADEVARAAGVIRSSAHQALQDLREVIGVLRADTIADGAEVPQPPQPTLVDLPALVEESRRAGMRIDWESGLDELAAVPESIGRNAYRVVQEGLTNARKHARGTAVTLAVDGAPGAGLTVEVRNRAPVDGPEVGIPGAGVGLVGLTERAQLAGGRLEHGRTGGGDFRLRAWLPWPA